jgi:hypothetical protein
LPIPQPAKRIGGFLRSSEWNTLLTSLYSLNAERIKTRYGCQFTITAITNILRALNSDARFFANALVFRPWRMGFNARFSLMAPPILALQVKRRLRAVEDRLLLPSARVILTGIPVLQNRI